MAKSGPVRRGGGYRLVTLRASGRPRDGQADLSQSQMFGPLSQRDHPLPAEHGCEK